MKFDVACDDSTFGLTITSDSYNDHGFISAIKSKSTIAKKFRTKKSMNNKLKFAFIIAVNDTPVFTKQEIIDRLTGLSSESAISFSITIAPESFVTAAKNCCQLI